MSPQPPDNDRLRDYRIDQCEKTIRGTGRSLDTERDRVNSLSEWKTGHEKVHLGLEDKVKTIEDSVTAVERLTTRILITIFAVGGITLLIQVLFKFI